MASDGDGQGPDGAGVAAAAGEQAAVEHYAAADEPADEDVKRVEIVGAVAEDELGGAGAGGVVAHVHRPWTDRRDLGFDVDAPPALHHIVRRADFLLPVPQFERRGDTKAADPPPAFRRQRGGQRGAAFPDEVEDKTGAR